MKAKILSLQFNPIIADKLKNYNKVRELIVKNSSSGLDLVVLPEFFSTGINDEAFINEPECEDSSPTLSYLSQVAREFNTNMVCGSIIEKDASGKLYNTSYALDRSGNIVAKYRKIHLYNYFGGNEGKTMSAGDTPVVANFDFARVGMSLCFDIRYPLLYKSLIKAGAEIIVSPSAWSNLASLIDGQMADFINTWRAFNITRAAENLVYFVTSNLVGKSYAFLYSIGNSMITGPMGEVLDNAQNSECALYQEIDLSVVRKLKNEYPIYALD